MKARRIFVGGLILFIIGFISSFVAINLKPVKYTYNQEIYVIRQDIILAIAALILLVFGMILVHRAAKLEEVFESLFGLKPPHTKWEKEEMQKRIDKIAKENRHSIEWIRKTAEAFGYVVKG